MATLPQRRRNDRGVAYPSPVVLLSVIAVAMASIAFFATRHQEPTEREITTVSESTTAPSPSSTPTTVPADEPIKKKKKKPEPVERGETYVVVYNNTGITGLAAQVAGEASQAGWQVVGADNWVGSIPSSTVYFPPQLVREAKLLALDLGIDRVLPAVEPMNFDRLTVILAG